MYFLPNKSRVCEKLFQEAGISANITLGEFPLYFIPFDYDMLSLELEGSFRVPPDFAFLCIPSKPRLGATAMTAG